MNLAERIENRIFKEITKLLSTKKLISIAKKYIKASNYMPIAIMYHHVSDIIDLPLSVTKDIMESTILFFQRNGFDFLFEEEFFEADTYSVILAFDDGYRDNYTNLLPLLKKHRIKASVNVIAEKLLKERETDYLDEAEIKEMIESELVSIQSHAYSHKKLLQCSEEELKIELVHSKRILEEKLGIKCSVLVTPYLQNSQKITTIAKKHYKLIYSDRIANIENQYCISRTGSPKVFSEKNLARAICLKAKENSKISHIKPSL